MTITQQQIIALAVEAGFDDITPWLDAENVEQGQIDAANRWIERMTAFAALVSAKENQARIKLQKEFMEYQNDMQARGTRLIKEAYQRGVSDEREALKSICEELEQHYSDYAATALLNGDIDLSNAASGEPRACRAMIEAIRARSDK